MTNEKPKKKSRLRNAEYYDMQEVLDGLYKDSQKGCTFQSLIPLIVCEENIKLAYRNIKRNSGSKTAGTDGATIKDLEKWKTENLIKHIQKKFNYYQPQSVRRVEIPKANGKTRPLGIPTIMDRLIQQCIYQVLEPITEAKFHERNNGFRSNRSAEHAMAQTYKMMQMQHLHYVIDIDIKSFFDNVQHGKLLKQLWCMGIRDKKLLKIISLMLKAEVAGIGFPEKGTPQGGIISPLLANVVLNELDWWIASQWEFMPTEYQFKCRVHTTGTPDKSKIFRALRRTRLKECYIIRYADDFKIFCRKRSDAEKLFVATEQWLKERLGLEISQEKSKIVNLKRTYSEFLGFKIKVRKKGKNPDLTDKYTVSSYLTDKSKKKIEQSLDKEIKLIQKPRNELEKLKNLGIYNSMVVGMHNYYSMATNVNLDFNKIAFQVNKKLYTRFGNELKKTGKIELKYIKDRYGQSKQMRFLSGKIVVPVGYVQHKSPMDKRRKVNKFTPEGRMLIHKNLETVNTEILHYLMRNPVPYQSIEYNDNRLSHYCANQGKCFITREILDKDNIHCHHITPRERGGKDDYGNLVLISENVHILLHAKRSETIAKYLRLVNPTESQLAKINKYREFLNLEKIEM